MRNKGSSIKDTLNLDTLNDLLKRLDRGPETPRVEYELIRQTARDYFASKGWPDAEFLIDETITQIQQQLSKLAITDSDHLMSSLLATAKKVLKAYLKHWAKTPEAFDRLLAWLNRDANRAADKYREIHAKLTGLFISYGFASAEDLADETINRVIKKLPEIQPTYHGMPELYFSGVAKKIRLEHSRFAQRHENFSDDHALQNKMPHEIPPGSSTDDSYHKCLEICMAKLGPQDRDLILTYYGEDDYQRVDLRKDLAKKLGITPGNLRVRKHRAQQAVERCMKSCLESQDSIPPSGSHPKTERG
jgi:DNA-directed RNA polymerase specialized sigma24 family protein